LEISNIKMITDWKPRCIWVW